MLQRGYSDEIPKEFPRIIAPNESHMSCLFVVDTSGSMINSIDSLNEGLRVFQETLNKDDLCRNRLDVAVIEFNDQHKLVQNWVPLSEFKPPLLRAGGLTYMAGALDLAMQMVRDQAHEYAKHGIRPLTPYIFLLSDGKPDDNIDAIAREIRTKEADKKFKVWTLGAGAYHKDTLRKISGDSNMLALVGVDFTEFFDWATMEFRNMSVTAPGHPVPHAQLPDSVVVDPPDPKHTIPDGW